MFIVHGLVIYPGKLRNFPIPGRLYDRTETERERERQHNAIQYRCIGRGVDSYCDLDVCVSCECRVIDSMDDLGTPANAVRKNTSTCIANRFMINLRFILRTMKDYTFYANFSTMPASILSRICRSSPVNEYPARTG